MKQRAIKRCIKRAQKQLHRGTFKGRLAVVQPSMTGAVFAFEDVYSVVRPNGSDCQWGFAGFKFKSGHSHWYNRGYLTAVAVSYV
ncbi:hypothetical protein [Escherichia phage NTNC80A]|uniref:Uncharacterized protein n=1 Tax=Escherichia phage NTNC80A TaxID=2970325 RepID=A0A976SPK8_9CAUD|nr:hypothetical protein [Escherichia phage NTNC80A]